MQELEFLMGHVPKLFGGSGGGIECHNLLDKDGPMSLPIV